MSTTGRPWSLRRKDRGVPGVDFAVAVRDGDALRLHLHLRREPEGDVYSNWPRSAPRWRPHASYHASGQLSFGCLTRVYQRARPDAAFEKAENIVTTAISLEEVRAIDQRCDPADFAEIFEIPSSTLLAGPPRQHTIAVDLVEVGGKEIWKPWSRPLGQKAFTDAVPWILVTLWEDDFAPEVAR